MSRVPLSRDDQWIDLRDAETVTERLRRPITTRMALLEKHGFSSALLQSKRADAALESDNNDQTREAAEIASKALAAVLSPECLDLLNEINDFGAVAVIREWSFPVPVTVDGLLDVP